MPDTHRPGAGETAVATATVAARLRAVLAPLARQLRQQSTDPLSATQVSVLHSIHRHGPLTLGEVASRERLSPPRISKVVETLEEQGFVERERDEVDRRVWRVRATAEADGWIEQTRALRDAWLEERLASLGTDELAAVAAAIPVLEQLVEDPR